MYIKLGKKPFGHRLAKLTSISVTKLLNQNVAGHFNLATLVFLETAS